ncbi:MAG: Uma2 family endonuclease [Acidobacteria bacterium]|nr:Uma2 family endonuclease [Acidobacteriota bacterium]
MPLVGHISVDEYHAMIESGEIGPPVELIEGVITAKMGHSSRHSTVTHLAAEQLRASSPSGWVVRIQAPVTLDGSEPEPDIAVVRGRLPD